MSEFITRPLAHIDPDQHCAVTLNNTAFGRCQNRLNCRIHSEAQKAAVPDRGRPYAQLIQRQPGSLGHFQNADAPTPAPTPGQRPRDRVIIVDLDVHCAVYHENGTRCDEFFSCTFHSEEQQLQVQGRSAPLGLLRTLWLWNTVFQVPGRGSLDTHCGVQTDNSVCFEDLSCSKHSVRQKSDVEGRDADFRALLRIQQSQSIQRITALGGYGLVFSASEPHARTTLSRRRYRRDGMQAASLGPDHDGESPSDVYDGVLNPAGDNLARVRQILYGTNFQNPDQDIMRILNPDSVRDVSSTGSKIYHENSVYYFGFFDSRSPRLSLLSFQRRTLAGSLRDACLISAPGNAFNLDQNTAPLVMSQLRKIIDRVPFELQKLTEALKSVLLLHAIRLTPSLGEAKPKVHLPILKALVDNKPALVVELKTFDAEQWSTHTTKLAFLLHSDPRRMDVPPPERFYEFSDPKFDQNWLGANVSPEEKRQIFSIAAYTASSLNGNSISMGNLHHTLALICRAFGIHILVGQAHDKHVDVHDLAGDVASYNPNSRTISPSVSARGVAPWLNDITGVADATVAAYIMQCIRSRLLHCRDLWMAWTDGCNAADMHQQHGSVITVDQCSALDAETEWHGCGCCGCLTLCKDLERMPNVPTSDVRVCPTCRTITVPSESAQDAAATSAFRQFADSEDFGVADLARRKEKSRMENERVDAQAASSLELQKEVLRLAKELRELRAQEAQKREPRAAKKNKARLETQKLQGRVEASPLHPEKQRVRQNAKQSLRREHVLVYPDLTFPELRKAEDYDVVQAVEPRFRQGPTGFRWEDAYFSTPITEENSLLSAAVGINFPVVHHEGIPRVNIASNMCVTRLYATQLAGGTPAIVLKILHDLDASKDEKERDVCVAHLDCLHLIRSQVPFNLAPRLAREYDHDTMTTLEAQFRTGVPNIDACRKMMELEKDKIPHVWRMKVSQTFSGYNESQLPNIEQVRKFFAAVERESGTRFPRINGVPYFFKGGPTPDQGGWSFVTIYRLLWLNFETLKRACNRRHITSFDVSRLVCAVFYLLSFGARAQRSQLFNTPVCCYSRHFLGYSVGKADHAASMTTGLQDDEAISYERFDVNSCNLCVEPWPANKAKKNRDDDVPRIRADFRQNLKHDNHPHWPAQLAQPDPEIISKYVRNASYGEDVYDRGATNERARSWQTVPIRRNMHNLGETCYMSVVLQTLFAMPTFRSVINDTSSHVYKEATGMADVQFLPAGEFAVDLTQAEILEFRKQTLAKQKLLILAIRKLFDDLNNSGAKLPPHSTEAILRRINGIDGRWGNQSNESAQLLGMLIDVVVSATDLSGPEGRGRSAHLSEGQESDNRMGSQLFALTSDMTIYWEAFRGEGYDTPLLPFFSQVVKEVGCPEQDCISVSRGFDHSAVIYLDFPRDVSEEDDFHAAELFLHWQTEVLDVDNGHICERDRDHERSLEAYRCLTIPGEYICFAVRRGGAGAHVLNTVRFPDILDISSLTSRAKMPSTNRADDGELRPVEAVDYQLMAAVNYLRGHYIAYVRHPRDGSWVMFDDLQPTPTKKTPFDGWREDELAHYVVYRKHGVQDVNMQDAAGNDGQTGDGDALQTGDENRLQAREQKVAEDEADLVRRMAAFQVGAQALQQAQASVMARRDQYKGAIRRITTGLEEQESSAALRLAELDGRLENARQEVFNLEEERAGMVAGLEELRAQATEEVQAQKDLLIQLLGE